jgi:hypothetical protein
LKDGATTIQTYNGRDAFGNSIDESYANGVSTLRTFDPETGRLTDINTTKGSTVFQNNDYAWPSNGTLESRIANAAYGLGTIAEILTGPSGEAIIIGIIARAGVNKAIREAFERQLKEHGRSSLMKSHKSVTRRLNTHLQDLDKYKVAGGKTSSVEREIATFKRQLEILEELLKL